MRDPDATISVHEQYISRRLSKPLDESHFLQSQLAQQLLAAELITPFRVIDRHVVHADRITFITYPYEWPASQLQKAAELTFDIQQRALRSGFDLKDASAWNIIYAGTRPLFCDLLSFVPLRDRRWWAFGQFVRHFIFPQLAARRAKLTTAEIFKIWRDGMPVHVARAMMGWGRYLSRYWPLMAGTSKTEVASGVPAASVPPTQDAKEQTGLANFRASLMATLGWMLRGAAPKQPSRGAPQLWSDYTNDRAHYRDDSVAQKREVIAAWLDKTDARWVGDWGCNTGEFTAMALAQGRSVIAIDSDHDCIESLFKRWPDNPQLYPVLCSFDDFSGGRGWAGSEFQGLSLRLQGRVDVLMLLALIHHLMVGSSIPPAQIAALCHRCTRSWLIVELIGNDDPQFTSICAQRQRAPEDFSVESQHSAFIEAGFEHVETATLSSTSRSLVLYRRSE